MVGTTVLDKDGLSSLAIMADLIYSLPSGTSLSAYLRELYAKYDLANTMLARSNACLESDMLQVTIRTSSVQQALRFHVSSIDYELAKYL